MKKCFLSIALSIGLLINNAYSFGFKQSSLDIYVLGQFSLVSLFAYCNVHGSGLEKFIGEDIYEVRNYQMSNPAKYAYAAIAGLLTTYPIHWIMKRWSYESKLDRTLKELTTIRSNNPIVTMNHTTSKDEIFDLIKGKYYESGIWLHAAQKELSDLRTQIGEMLYMVNQIKEKFYNNQGYLSLCDHITKTGHLYIINITRALNIINDKSA